MMFPTTSAAAVGVRWTVQVLAVEAVLVLLAIDGDRWTLLALGVLSILVPGLLLIREMDRLIRGYLQRERDQDDTTVVAD